MKMNKQLIIILVVALCPQLVFLIGMMIWDGVSTYLIGIVCFIFFLQVIYCSTKLNRLYTEQTLTITNLIESMVNDEYSFRYKNPRNDPISTSINKVFDKLINKTLEIKKQELLISKIVDNVDIYIISFDDRDGIDFINKAAQNLIGEFTEPVIDVFKPLIDTLNGGVVTCSFSGIKGSFLVNKDCYFENGFKKELIFFSDVKNILNEAHNTAWDDLVRVMSHEVNNSLTPIIALSQSLKGSVTDRDDDFCRELYLGLDIIENRSKYLKKFIDRYRSINKLPNPLKDHININDILKGVLPFFRQRKINLVGDMSLNLYVDPVQIEQALINILKNADEAMKDPNGIISIKWEILNTDFYLEVIDQGEGISNIENLFVPLYTTKVNGSGIGLTLTKKIIEGHGGEINLINLGGDHGGCKAVFRIPTS